MTSAVEAMRYPSRPAPRGFTQLARRRTLAAGLVLALVDLPAAHAGVSITFVPPPRSLYDANPPSVYPTEAALNASLGVSSYVIDDFSSATLISGLTINLSGGNAATWTVLPAIFNQNNYPACGLVSWIGATGIVNYVGNTADCSTSTGLAQRVEFDYPAGATAFGIGLANFQAFNTHELFVNGVDQGSLETLGGARWTDGLVLNAYLLINGTAGTVITSVAVQNNSPGIDGFGFSDLAILPVTAGPSSSDGPIPLSALGALGAGLIGIASRRMKKRAD